MRRLFIQFYLLLMLCFGVGALLVGLVYREVADTTGTRLLTDLLRTTLALIESELRTVPQPQWPQALAALDHDLGFPLALTRLETLPIDAEAMRALKSGEIIMQEDETTYLQRLDRTPYVLVAGPMPYLVFLQELHWVDIALLGLIGALLALPVFLWMRPHWRELQQLERSARALADGQFDVRVTLPQNSGLQPLAQGFNHMADSVQLLLDNKQTLLHAVAHELRTPLARLKARIELGLREREPQQWYATLEKAAQSTDRLTHLANQLLSLARAEAAGAGLSEGGAERVELAQLARELGMALAPLAHQRGIALALEADTEVWLRGEPMLLHELIYNLVDNALAHTPGGNVVVRVLAPALLEVEDDGPGIPPEERERVFERFYRRNPHVGGAGLGLAIVGEICRAHRAEIELGRARWAACGCG